MNEKEIVELCLKDFYSFYIYLETELKGDAFKTGQFEKEYCDFLQYDVLYSALNGEYPLATIEACIQHGKSEKLQVFSAWLLGIWAGQQRYVNYYTASKVTAREFMIRMEGILGSKIFQKCFGGTKSTAKNEYFCGKSVMYLKLFGGGNVGVPSHFSIVDDPYGSYLEALSVAIREKKFETLQGNIISRRQTMSAVVVMHSRWFSDDMIGRLKAQYSGKPNFMSRVWKAIKDDGTTLFPELRPLSFLEDQREKMGELLFQANYQQRPIDLEKSNIKTALFREYGSMPEGEPDEDFIVMDTAYSTRDNSDKSVVTWAQVVGGRCYVRDVIAGHWDMDELRRQVKNFLYATGSKKVYIENKSSGISLLQTMKNEIERGDLKDVSVEPIFPTVMIKETGLEKTADKFTRWLEVEPAVAHGCFCIPREAQWKEEFLKQCVAFDGKGGYHDDFVDSTLIYTLKACFFLLDFQNDKDYPKDEAEPQDPFAEDDFSFGSLGTERGLDDGGISM